MRGGGGGGVFQHGEIQVTIFCIVSVTKCMYEVAHLALHVYVLQT